MRARRTGAMACKVLEMRLFSVAFAVAAIAATTAAVWAAPACDSLGEPGWSLVPTVETTGQVDSAPYQAGASGNWFVDRTTALLPFCNYYNSLGIYSLRSYSLSPEMKKERIGICQRTAQGGSAAVAPYAGQCPPQ